MTFFLNVAIALVQGHAAVSAFDHSATYAGYVLSGLAALTVLSAGIELGKTK